MKMNIKNILEKHKLWAEGEEGGERVDLRNADLRGANLQGANLREADLREANLREADLREADLQEANLQEANLQGANLRGAGLQGADLRGAGLQGADLRGADLDFSCWPLWCGSLNVKVDERLISQLMYHICSLDVSECDDEKIQNQIKVNYKLANNFIEYRRELKELK